MRLWQINADNSLLELSLQAAKMEKQIEDWIHQDISLISKDILLLARHIQPSFGGLIDFIGVNSYGDVVVLEIKKDRSPKELIADVLEHASWIRERSSQEILELGTRKFGDENAFKDHFNDYFSMPFPEVFNKQHKILLIGTSFDQGSERILQYLSQTYGININAVLFTYFRKNRTEESSMSENEEFLVRNFLMDDTEVNQRMMDRMGIQRNTQSTVSDLKSYAADHKAGSLFEKTMEIKLFFEHEQNQRDCIEYIGRIKDKETPIFSIFPKKSSREKGVYFQVELTHFTEYFQVTDERELLRRFTETFDIEGVKGKPDWYWGFIRSEENLEELVMSLERYHKRKRRY